MCVSKQFCEQHLQLLFSIFTTASSPQVRANVIIALGDMAFRFPNLIEPWSHHLYANLKDTSAMVRKNTLMVLTHLILNDMLKAKGPVAEIAKRLEDPDARIASLCRVFFVELSHKGKSPIYNVLPDVISRLSRDASVSNAYFQCILRFLIGFIEKDKQTESLVEKLCHRFNVVQRTVTATDDKKEAKEQPMTPAPAAELAMSKDRLAQQYRNIAFCLNQLKLNAKCMTKIIALFPCYKNRLGDDAVHASFQAILAKGRKFANAAANAQEMKLAFEEFETNLKSQREKMVEDRDATLNARRDGASLAVSAADAEAEDAKFAAMLIVPEIREVKRKWHKTRKPRAKKTAAGL
jgi:condensin complex subunit 1